MAPITMDGLASLLYTVLGKLDRLEHTQRILREQHDLILGHLSIGKLPLGTIPTELDPYQPFKEQPVLPPPQPPQHTETGNSRQVTDFTVLGIHSASELPALALQQGDDDRPRSRSSNKPEIVSRPSSRARVTRNSPQYLPPEVLDGEWQTIPQLHPRPRSSKPRDLDPFMPQAALMERPATVPLPSYGRAAGNSTGISADFLLRQRSEAAPVLVRPPPPLPPHSSDRPAASAAADPPYVSVETSGGQRVYRRADAANRVRSAHPRGVAQLPSASTGNASAHTTRPPDDGDL